MSTTLSYNLLPAHRCANNNFRRTFLTLAVIESILTICSTTTCLILSICIYTRRPFIILHTTFHPYIQASILLTAALTQLFKLVSLLYCGGMIVYCDGEIFLANARLETCPSLELVQSINSPNDVARKCFNRRQDLVKKLRKIMGFYPVIQLLCGTLTLAFWCSSEEGRAEGHIGASRYYQLLKHISGTSHAIFLIYLISWCFDLFITPIFLLITTWHYARVDWQIQVLTAQAPPYFVSRHSTRDGGAGGGHSRRSSYSKGFNNGRAGLEKRRNSLKRMSLRRRGRFFVSLLKEQISTSSLKNKKDNLVIKQDQEHSQDRQIRSRSAGEVIHDKGEPASVPVSPSESLYSHYSTSELSSRKDSLKSEENSLQEDLTVLPIHIMITPNDFDLIPFEHDEIKSGIEKEKGHELAIRTECLRRECFVLGNAPSDTSSNEEEDHFSLHI